MTPRRILCSATLILCAFLFASCARRGGSPGPERTASPNSAPLAFKTLDRLPLHFERADAGEGAHFDARLAFGQLRLAEDGVSIALAGVPRVLSLRISGGDGFVRPEPIETLPGKVHYLRGRDQTKWRTNVPTFGKVQYDDVFPGIDMTFYGTTGELEYDFIVAPGADPQSIAFRIDGAESVSPDSDGDLIIDAGGKRLTLRAPVAFQEVSGARVPVSSRYALGADRSIRIELASYDRTKTLIIDPVLEFSTYLGGNSGETAYAVTADSSGNIYVTGYTGAPDFPVSGSAFDTTRNGAFNDAFVTKINPTTGAIIYSTYLGGTGFDEGRAVAVDSDGNAFVAGRTASNDFPTQSAFQSSYGGQTDAIAGASHGDAFVVKLDPTGSSLVYSTYLGGTWADEALAIAVDSSGNAYVAGDTASPDFPTEGAFQETYGGMPAAVGGTPPTGDAFLTKLDPEGDALVYSTYLGGSAEETGHGVAVDSMGRAYVTGSTDSDDFPTQTPFQSARAGQSDSFIVRMNADGAGLSYATYLGGTGSEETNGLALDAQNNVYIAGTTFSSNYPVTEPFQGSFGGLYDGFLAKLSSSGTLKFATYLGGAQADEALSVRVDGAGFPYVAGTTKSSDFPLKDAAQSTLGTDGVFGVTFDAFALQLRPDGSELVYSTFVGGTSVDAAYGLAVDAERRAHIVGSTGSSDFPLENEFQASLALGQDAFVSTVGAGSITTALDVSTILPATGGNKGTVTALITGENLYAISSVKLVAPGLQDITAESVAASEDGKRVAAQFDLFGETTGLRDLVVRSETGDEITRPGAFTVVAYEEGRLWVSVTGRTRVRNGRASIFTVTYGNDGNNDAKAVPLWVWTTPEDAELSAEFPTGPEAPVGSESGWDDTPLTVSFDGARHLPLIIPLIPAGGTGAIDISINFPNVGDFTVDAIINEPMYQAVASQTVSLPGTSPFSEDVFIDTAYACVGGLFDLMVSRVSGGLPSNCIAGQLVKDEFEKAMNNSVPDELLNRVVARDNQRVSQAKLLKKYAQMAYDCAGIKNPGIAAFDLAEFALKASQTIDECKKASQGCTPGEFCGPLPDFPVNGGGGGGGYSPRGDERAPNRDTRKGSSTGSVDPNEKYGPQGGAESHFIKSEKDLEYVVLFENLPAATAPAQEVRITDQLDGTTMDLSTFSLGAIRFGSRSVTPPPGLKEYTTDVDLRPEKNMLVRITAALDSNTGVVSWLFRSLDPATGDLPDDPTEGFLPPNTTSPQGEGRVEFTVSPKAGLADGTTISNSASIVFDANAAIVTNTWSNVIDNTAPSSSIAAKRAAADGKVPVSWTGTDQTAGIRDFSILVSEDGGATYETWTQTSEPDGEFEGTAGKTYTFLSTATDNAENYESGAGKTGVSVEVPLSSCTLKVDRKCRKAVKKGTKCRFTTAVKNAQGKKAKNARYKLEREQSVGDFRKAKSGRTGKTGSHTLEIPIKKTGTYRAISDNPLCTSGEIEVTVKKGRK